MSADDIALDGQQEQASLRALAPHVSTFIEADANDVMLEMEKSFIRHNGIVNITFEKELWMLYR